MSVPSRTDFWGVELTAKKKEAVWDAEEEDDQPRDDPDIVHTLHIQRIILGPTAKDESHLVSITAQNFSGEDLTHPLCWLSKKSVSESQCSMHMALPPPVTLQLTQGSGPVHVIGIWEQQLEEDISYSSDEDEEGDKMDDAIDSLDIKPVKDEEAKQKKRPATSPPAKPAKVAKKDEKVPKLAAAQKKPTADQDSEDEDDDDDDEEDEEQEDDDENEEESDEEGEEEEEEEEDSEDEPLPPPKKKPQTKAIVPKQKANTPKSIGDKAAKKPGKGATPQVSRSLDELKAMLAKSPNVPKKREKFNNYLQNNFKVTNPDVKNKLWNFVQQSKH